MIKIPFFNLFDEEGNLDPIGLLITVITCILIFGVAAFAYNRVMYQEDVMNQSLQVNDPDRLQAIETEAWALYHGLEGQATSIAALKQQRADLVEGLGERSTWPLDVADSYSQLGEQISQTESAFNQSCSSYKAKLSDPAQNVALKDLPQTCPPMEPAAQ